MGEPEFTYYKLLTLQKIIQAECCTSRFFKGRVEAKPWLILFPSGIKGTLKGIREPSLDILVNGMFYEKADPLLRSGHDQGMGNRSCLCLYTP